MHVLIVNAIMMGDNNATGITMKNMLYGIENVDYLQLCVDYRVNAHEQLVETMFINLDNLMIHGIYYERDPLIGKMIPIYDNSEYPQSFLMGAKDYIERGLNPPGPFGTFRGH